MPQPRFFLACLILGLGVSLPLGAEAQRRKSEKSEKSSSLKEQEKKALKTIFRLRKGRLDKRDRKKLLRSLRKQGKGAERPIYKYWQKLDEDDAAACLEILAKLGTRRSLAALDQASYDERVAVQEIAASQLSEYPKNAKAAPALERLMGSDDAEVRQSAVLGLGRLGTLDAWGPLFNKLKQAPQGLSLGDMGKGLANILTQNFSVERVEEVVHACASAPTPAARDALFRALSECRAERVLPYMVRFAHEGLGKKAKARARIKIPSGADVEGSVERVFGKEGGFAPLRPFPGPLLAQAVTAVGEARDKRTFPVLLESLGGHHVEVRRAALRVAAWSIPDAESRRKLVGAVILRLTDKNRGLRGKAHSWLQRETGEELPLSFARWQRWHSTSEDEQVLAAVTAIAKQQGWETLEEMLREGGYQFLEDYLADGGREKVREFLDREERERSEGRRDRRRGRDDEDEDEEDEDDEDEDED